MRVKPLNRILVIWCASFVACQCNVMAANHARVLGEIENLLKAPDRPPSVKMLGEPAPTEEDETQRAENRQTLLLEKIREVPCDELVDWYSRRPKEEMLWYDNLFYLVSDRWIERQLELLARGKGARLVLPSFEGKAPAALGDCPPDLLRAWRSYRTLRASAPELESSNAPAQAPRAAEPTISREDLTRAFFLGRVKDAGKVAHRFRWNSWCGTGMEVLGNWQERMNLMDDLRTGSSKALAASLLPHFPPFQPVGDSSFRWQTRAFELFGLDREEVLAGAMVEGAISEHHMEGNAAANFLGTHCSEKGANLLFAYFRWQQLHRGPFPLSALGSLVQPGPRPNEPQFLPKDVPTRAASAPKLPPQYEKEALDILGDFAASKGAFLRVERAVAVLSYLLRPETREILRSLATHPDPSIRELTHAALQRMGQEVPKGSPTAPLPVTLLINKKPMAKLPLVFFVFGYLDCYVSGRGNYLQTDEFGRVSLPREDLLDPGEGPVVRYFQIHTGPDAPRETPIFAVEIPVVGDLDALPPVEVVTKQLVVHLRHPHPERLAVSDAINVCFMPARMRGRDEVLVQIGATEILTHPAQTELVFPNIQPGLYRIEVRCPGAAIWQSAMFAVGEHGGELTADLAPASNITFTLPWDERRKRPGYFTELAGPGVKMDELQLLSRIKADEAGRWTYQYLPVGAYSIRVFPAPRGILASDSEEKIKPVAEFPVVVDSESPTIIDLGALNLTSIEKPTIPK